MENAFRILVSRFMLLLNTMEQRPKIVRGILLTCVVAQHPLDTSKRRNQAIQPTELKESRGQQAKQDTYFRITSTMLVYWLCRMRGPKETRRTSCEAEVAGIFQSFSEPKTLYLS